MHRTILTGLVIVLITPLAFGQKERKTLQGSVPTLNGHRFVDNRIVDNPFLNSLFELRMGYGNSQRLRFPEIEIGDTVIRRTTGGLIFLNLNTRIQIKLKDWLTYQFEGGGSGRVGTDPGSLLTNGLNTFVGVYNGWKIRLYHDEKQYLSTQVGVRTNNATVTNIQRYVQQILDGVPSPNLSEDIFVLQGVWSLSYAYGASSLLGFAMDTKLVYGDLFEPGKSGWTGSIGAAIDLNLYPKTSIPLGFSFAYAYANLPDFTTAQYNTESYFNTKIAFTQSENFIISLETTTYKAPYLLGFREIDQNEDTRVQTFSLNMLIYFD